MIQELKKDIKAVVLSEYKLMACILVVLIIFWKFINKLISTYIVCITETVTNDSLFIALIFFLCPVFIALIKRDLCKTFIYRKNLAYMTKISIYLCLEAYCNVYIGIIDAVKRLLSSIFVSNFLLFESIGHNYPWRSI